MHLDFPSPSTCSLGKEEGGTVPDPSSASPEKHPLRVAAKAYSLFSVLMMILMHARVLNEEPLVLKGAEIGATGKLVDPQSLLCYHGHSSPGVYLCCDVHQQILYIIICFFFPECQRFSIPPAFNNSLGRAAAGNNIMQLLFQVTSKITLHTNTLH